MGVGVWVLVLGGGGGGGRRDDFKTGLRRALKKEGYGTVVGVCSCANVDAGFEIWERGGGERWVV